MSPFEKLNDKALLLLMNQLRVEFWENNHIDFQDIDDFFSNSDIISNKSSYFGIDNIELTDMTYLYDLFLNVDDIDEEITELPPRPKLKKLKVVWSEDVTEFNRYFYSQTVESYCNLSTDDMQTLRSEDLFDPWEGKMYHKEILDSETTDDECTDVTEI